MSDEAQANASDPQILEYEIDAEDRLTQVSPSWVDFARANSAPHLTPEAVLGRRLLDFITDEATREIYRVMLGRARSAPGPMRVHFRCDGPDVRRFMVLEVEGRPDGSVHLTSRLLRMESRDAVPILSVECTRQSSLVTMCGWCKRVRVNGGWLEIEDAVEKLGLFETDPQPRLTHGICEACEARAYEEMEARPA